METKKSEVIPFRTTKFIREKLEKDAETHGWKTAKMVEKIISEYYEIREDEEKMIAMEIYNLIVSKKITSINELTKWAIKTNNLKEIANSTPLWSELIKEIKNVDEADAIIQNDSFVCPSHLHFFIAVRSKNGYIFFAFPPTKLQKSLSRSIAIFVAGFADCGLRT